MALYFTGDTHAIFNRFRDKHFDYSGKSKDKDYMIILGDFGGIFQSQPCAPEHNDEKTWLDWFATRPMTFIIIPGNHENYSAVETNYPLDYFKGAKARYLRKNVIWIERGEILELCGKILWCFGGAYSVDKAYRTPEHSWWHREQASQEEFDYGYKTFVENKSKIDFILTHDAPASIISMMFSASSYPSETERFLERIMWQREGHTRWCCGHLHQDFVFDDTFRLFYYDIEEVV